DQGLTTPVISANNLTVGEGQSVSLSSIFSISGTGITQYQIWFSWAGGGAPALGTLTNNGTAVPLNQPVMLTSISNVVYTGSSTIGTDRMWLQAYNGNWSNNGQWLEADISDRGSAGSFALASLLTFDGTVAGMSGASGTDFLFASSRDTSIDASKGAQAGS